MATLETTGVAKDWLEADGLILLESWARDGYTIQNIANRIGVSQQCLRGWMNKYPEIKKAINTGRELVDYKVENALLKAALGYKTKEVRVATIIRNGKVLETQKETIEREQAPNVSACQTWLYNRKPKTWRNMNSRSNMFDELDEDTSIHITVERAGASEGKNNANAPVSSTIDEVDTDWQNDVNRSVTIRGMTEEEKKKRAKQKEDEKSKSTDEDDTVVQYDDDEKQSTVDTTTDSTDDLDYWPDDWEDEDEE